MRSMLHQGLGDEENLCPVCGQKVTSLPSDAVLDNGHGYHAGLAGMEKIIRNLFNVSAPPTPPVQQFY